MVVARLTVGGDVEKPLNVLFIIADQRVERDSYAGGDVWNIDGWDGPG